MFDGAVRRGPALRPIRLYWRNGWNARFGSGYDGEPRPAFEDSSAFRPTSFRAGPRRLRFTAEEYAAIRSRGAACRSPRSVEGGRGGFDLSRTGRYGDEHWRATTCRRARPRGERLTKCACPAGGQQTIIPVSRSAGVEKRWCGEEIHGGGHRNRDCGNPSDAAQRRRPSSATLAESGDVIRRGDSSRRAGSSRCRDRPALSTAAPTPRRRGPLHCPGQDAVAASASTRCCSDGRISTQAHETTSRAPSGFHLLAPRSRRPDPKASCGARASAGSAPDALRRPCRRRDLWGHGCHDERRWAPSGGRLSRNPRCGKVDDLSCGAEF